MIATRKFRRRVVTWTVCVWVVAGCSLEVNIHVADSDEVESTQPAPEPPVAPEPPAPPAPPRIGLPLRPVPPIVTAEPLVDDVIRDALLRRNVPTNPGLERRPTADVSREPVFTPFTVAPSIRNRSEVVRAIEQAYPPLLRDAGIGGRVLVYFFIDAEGNVGSVRIDKTSGHAALDAAALTVAEVYRFRPAENRGVDVPVWVSFPITFQVR